MKIVLLISFSGPGWSGESGDVVERPDDEARRLIERGYAREPEAVRTADRLKALAGR